MNKNLTWTLRDQQELEALQARRIKFYKEKTAPVLDVARNIVSAGWDSPEELAQTLIQYADSLRDALAPFDSGVRMESVFKSEPPAPYPPMPDPFRGWVAT